MRSDVRTPAEVLTEPVLLVCLTPLRFSVTVKVPVESDNPAPWNLTPKYFHGNQYVKSIPPPQPLGVESPERVVVIVWVGNGGIDMNLVDVPVGLLPVHVAYVPNAPISNSFGLK